MGKTYGETSDYFYVDAVLHTKCVSRNDESTCDTSTKVRYPFVAYV